MGGELQDHHFDGLFLCTEHQIDFGIQCEMFKTTKNLEVSKLSIGIPQISFGVVSAEVTK
ncbi:hypothetical protein CN582_15055 [Bacillus wiedmannii]|nr:hypothetical protein CN580_04175 [Bacillus wiedmannii]PEP98022.1 hypothetical protein CN582_15055 [Bacillus wiedmannii]PFY69482.1 hypothetical protein COL61_21945 [Bacillus wiedmannii]PHF10935.1 hypothetical protein COF74_02165 [Bacillus wiedmannii]PHF97715.1 hypothetical protein COI45_01695 [Bacillus wiedmannii]